MGTELNCKLEGFIVRMWKCIKKIRANVAKTVKKIGENNGRSIVHSLKVALAITIICLLYYLRPAYDGFGVAGMWAILTVIFVFEGTVGATLNKGLIRAVATMLGGCLALVTYHLSILCGQGELIFLGVSVFLLAAASTFSRSFPQIKARYDYGVFVFFLTYILIAVSGFRKDELFEMAYQRLISNAAGGLVCILVSIFICPVWAGTELHQATANNLGKLADFLEGFGEFFKGKQEEEIIELPRAYKCVLNSKSSEESLANFAIWEPRHGQIRFRHPWSQYLKICSLVRQCAYSIEALQTSCISSKAKGHVEFRKHIEGSCNRMSLESGKALRALSVAIKGMNTPALAATHVNSAKAATGELMTTLKIVLQEESPVLEIIRMATVASLLVEIVGHVEELAEAVKNLAEKAKFENVARGEEMTPKVAPLPVDGNGNDHVAVDIKEQDVAGDIKEQDVQPNNMSSLSSCKEVIVTPCCTLVPV